MVIPSNASAVRYQRTWHLFCSNAFYCYCFEKIINVLCNCFLIFLHLMLTSAVIIMEYSKLIKWKKKSSFLVTLKCSAEDYNILLSGGFFCHSIVGNSRGEGYSWNGNGEWAFLTWTLTQTMNKMILAEYHGEKKIIASGAVKCCALQLQHLVRKGKQKVRWSCKK